MFIVLTGSPNPMRHVSRKMQQPTHQMQRECITKNYPKPWESKVVAVGLPTHSRTNSRLPLRV